MNTTDRVVLGAIRATGIFQVLLGIVFWTGHWLQVVPLHMIVGLVFVVALWTLSARAALAGAGRGLAAAAALWGVVVIAFGMTQARILPGEHHWIIRLLHLLVGVAAMGLADRLARRLSGAKRARVPAAVARPA